MNRQAILEGLDKVQTQVPCACETGSRDPLSPLHERDCWKAHTLTGLRGLLAAAETRPDLTDRDLEDVERGAEAYPAVVTRADNLLHVYQASDRAWCVWLNTQVSEFDGLCIGVGSSRQAAVQHAVESLEAATDHLQGPPW